MKEKAELQQLADAMNNLANAIDDFNTIAKELKQETGNFSGLLTTLNELNKRLMSLCTRL